MRINGAVLQARPSNEGNELLDEEHGETLSNENGEYRGDGYNEGLVAQRQGLRVTEYGEDWESVTFVGSDEEVNVEGDDEPELTTSRRRLTRTMTAQVSGRRVKDAGLSGSSRSIDCPGRFGLHFKFGFRARRDGFPFVAAHGGRISVF